MFIPRCKFAESFRDLSSSVYIEVRQHAVSDRKAKAVGVKLNNYSPIIKLRHDDAILRPGNASNETGGH